MNDSIITLTVTELRSMLSELKEDILNAVRAEATSHQDSEVRGRIKASKALGVSTKVLTDYVKTGILGSALWKRQTPGKNAIIYLDVRKGKQRHIALQQMTVAEMEAWKQLGQETAEAEWQRRGM